MNSLTSTAHGETSAARQGSGLAAPANHAFTASASGGAAAPAGILQAYESGCPAPAARLA
ncbi:hypothetical protein GCM10009750_30270 [Agromyces salentinus]|uniref:Uncharacterized protein n=1 Tax=Agromyces salentinus TaxID=269421 RepID=A0ABN2MXI6_9MICO